jgi:Lipoxygenase
MPGFVKSDGSVLNQIPHWLLELIGAGKCPGVPLCSLDQLIKTLALLLGRATQVKTAVDGLTTPYTIGGTTARALQFLFDANTLSPSFEELITLLKNDADGLLDRLIEEIRKGAASPPPMVPQSSPLTARSLESANQWAIAWTTYAGIHENAVKDVLEDFAASLDPSRPNEASASFWPTIAQYGLPYNLLNLEKVSPASLPGWQNLFASVWQPGWTAAGASLYVIDLRLFENLPVDTANSRFTPSTVTLLRQDPATKSLVPVAVRVAGKGGSGVQFYVESSPAWLYALEAARTSLTVYGVWIGHVYHWHVVTAAMLLAARETLPGPWDGAPTHPVAQLLAPQSKYLFEFDLVLLLLWSQVAPPTSVDGPVGFLLLMSEFAGGRTFFMDDPLDTLARNGIAQADFTVTEPWDRYPIVKTFLAVWQATEDYVSTFVDVTYPAGSPPAKDAALQSWIQKAADKDVGNVPGLPPQITTNDELKRVLTSLIYRITIHGSSRLLTSANPGLTYVANFPPCLQDATIPAPTTPLTPKSLFAYLPVTGTIGKMATFYYTFTFSRPYESFVPEYGVESKLFFPGGPTELRNKALIDYRRAVESLIDELSPVSTPGQSQPYQWPLSIET